MIYLTSDLHLNHNRDFVWKSRGYNSVEEMNRMIVTHWNQIVRDGDTVFILGDIMMGTDYETAFDHLSALHGNKAFLIGNHDSPKRVSFYQEKLGWTNMGYSTTILYNGYTCLLSHYPTITQNGKEFSKHEVLNFYGHTHQPKPWSPIILFGYNVGIDAHPFSSPISIDCAIQDFLRCIERNYNYD